jgi:hypothetical protein
MWVAHFSFHLFAGWQSLLPVAARFLHLPDPSILAGQVPAWLTTAQLLVLDGGLVLSVCLAWNTARREAEESGRPAAMLAPWAVLAIGIYAAAVWIIFQPMQMRGMVM